MWPVSSKFLSAMRYSHTKVTRVDLYRDNVVLESDLPVNTAKVEEDITADVRRRCSVSLPLNSTVLDLLPRSPDEFGGLWPIGNELRIRSGIIYDDGTEEMVPMGVYRISKVDMGSSSTGDRTVEIQGYDRSRAVARNRFIRSYQISQEAEDVPTEIKKLLQNRLPILGDDDFSLMSSNYNPPPIAFIRDDIPWKDAAVPLAKSIGAEVLFDGEGKGVVRPFPNPDNDPVAFEYIEGETAIFLDMKRSMDDEQGYNGVIASGQNSEQNEAPPEGEAWDDDPTSPTYFDPAYPDRSIYGAVPYFYVSEFLLTDEQCSDAAEGILRDVMGVLETIDLSAICNPAHEAGDIVKLKHEDIQVDDLCILYTLSFNLGNEDNTLTAATKRRRIR
jgi:Domain of unknown function (DUF5047)